jgi:CubicO group peptidase (beta-lactamase class C family)
MSPRRRIACICTAILPILFYISTIGAQVPSDLSGALSKIDAMAAAELAKDGVGSVTVGVVSGAKLVWSKSYGFADMEKKTPADQETVYRIGSITKQFTGLMLLQLAEQGKVALSDPVEKYFPEVNKVQGRLPNAPPITLVQLATMTSGLDREPADLATYLKGPVADWDKVLISALPHTKYAFEPDTHYYYSNIGYAILGATIARAAGMPYTRYVHEKIFTPLEMTHSAFEPTPFIRQHLSKGYEVSRDGAVDSVAPQREHDGRGYKVPNGAMYTTVGDLARFLSLELGENSGNLLKKETQTDNYTRVNSSNGILTTGYGIGFQLARKGDRVYIGHGGSVAGYRAEAYVDREAQTGVIVLRNVGGGKFDLAGLCFRSLEELAQARPKRR